MIRTIISLFFACVLITPVIGAPPRNSTVLPTGSAGCKKDSFLFHCLDGGWLCNGPSGGPSMCFNDYKINFRNNGYGLAKKGAATESCLPGKVWNCILQSYKDNGANDAVWPAVLRNINGCFEGSCDTTYSCDLQAGGKSCKSIAPMSFNCRDQ